MDKLLTLLVCPCCRDGDLMGLDVMGREGALSCSNCSVAYQVRGGIPILVPPDADVAKGHDELEHAYDHKHRQSGYFDRGVAEEFETSRPHGTPRAHRWLLTHKLLRSLHNLQPLAGATVVDACCGSGMDAEYLTRCGARVLAIDLSEGAARRAKARAERFGLSYLVVVGDVERLPIRSRSADVAYVHDGLHHLSDPAIGILELARVANRAVSINEPADAALTQAAVLIGLSTNFEEAGNAVRRLRPDAVQTKLEASGFDVEFSRYLMFYRHEPTRVMHLLSQPVLFPLFKQLMVTANIVAGQWGNKLSMLGLRSGV